MKKIAFVFIILSLTFVLASADFDRTTGLIDIPVARVMPGGTYRGFASGILTVGNYRDRPADFNTGFAYGIGDWGEVTISMLTTVDYTLNFNSVLVKESEGTPALGVGISNITYRKYVSELGHSADFGYSDDVDYIKVARRPHEQFSLYFVATKDFGGSYGEYTVGLGRGKYVGYGPHSHLFNTDMLFASTNQKELMGKANEDAFGLFFGGRWQVAKPVSFMLEFDGRDVNAGFRFKMPIAEFDLAWTHLEQIGKSHRTRVSFGASVSSMAIPKSPEYASISLKVYDEDTKKPLNFNVNLERGERRNTFAGKLGRIKMKLLPGEYVMKVVIPGYKWKSIKLTLKPGDVRAFKLGLKKKKTKEELVKEKEFDANFASGVTAFNKGEYKNAMLHLEKCLLLKPGNEDATAYYKKASSAFQKQFDEIKFAAEVLEKKGDYKGALKEYENLLNIDPGNNYVAAKVKEMNYKLKAPVKPEKSSTAPKPTTPAVSDVDIDKWYKTGLNYFSRGQYKKAITMFNKVLRYRPNHRGARKYLNKARTRLKALGG
ncbi:MAG: hypothetical protein B5M53_10940 [Candidatus Cloacimonas sp. 4484_209]|nr:MAG: hypothetical protein B5M53_10940 [Candidatus Cloacimonas sp. 4484_209]